MDSSPSSSSPPFLAFDVAIELVRAVREALAVLSRRDPSLADQLRRAVASVPLNVAEGNRRVGKDRLHSFRVAAGSAAEVRACLLVAEAFGHLDAAGLSEPLRRCDRELRLLHGLTRGAARPGG